MVSVIVFLAASALQVSKEAIGKLHSSPCIVLATGIVLVVSSAGLLVSVLWAFVTVQRALRPRGARFYGTAQKGRDLMWQEHVIAHGSSADYFTAVHDASPELILRNYTDQIFELAHISKEKMDALRGARWVMWLAFWSWIVCIASGLALLRYP
ncbi:MAG: hypothetical protein ACM3PW_10735 [Chlamydiota bacterium]